MTQGTRDEGQERIDALISAAMDDELLAGDRAELDRLIAENPAVSARVRAFHRIDAGLRNAGTEDVTRERLAASFAEVEARLGFAKTSPSPKDSIWRDRAGPLVLAAAAAFALYWWVSGPATTPNEIETPPPPALATLEWPAEGADFGAPDEAADAFEDDLEAGFDEALAVALGYVEGPNGTGPVQGIPTMDFEIIDQLELLEYLAARDAEGRG